MKLRSCDSSATKAYATLADARAYISEGSDGQLLAATASACTRPACATARRSGSAGWSSATVWRTSMWDSPFCRGTARMGYAVESASAVLDHARQVLGLQRIVAITSPENLGSIAVLEKIGLKFERMIRLGEDSPELKLFGPADASNGDLRNLNRGVANAPLPSSLRRQRLRATRWRRAAVHGGRQDHRIRTAQGIRRSRQSMVARGAADRGRGGLLRAEFSGDCGGVEIRRGSASRRAPKARWIASTARCASRASIRTPSCTCPRARTSNARRSCSKRPNSPAWSPTRSAASAISPLEVVGRRYARLTGSKRPRLRGRSDSARSNHPSGSCAAARCGWGDAACAAPWLLSAGSARG